MHFDHVVKQSYTLTGHHAPTPSIRRHASVILPEQPSRWHAAEQCLQRCHVFCRHVAVVEWNACGVVNVCRTHSFHVQDGGGRAPIVERQKAVSKTVIELEMSSSREQQSRNSSKVTTPSWFRSIFCNKYKCNSLWDEIIRSTLQVTTLGIR